MEAVTNTSGVSPAGYAVLLRIEDALPKPQGGLILPEAVETREQMLSQTGIVVEIGGEAWRDEKTPRCQVGDTVLLSQYSGYLHQSKRDGKRYRIVNDRDIFAVFKSSEAV